MVNLSIIIPAYNAQNTISRTLSSIYSSPLPENYYEVIIIDDCSTDSTVSVVLDFASFHSNLKLLRHTKNQRQGTARNWGIREAVGTYVMLVDADDIVEPGIKEAVQLALSSNSDVVFCNYLWMYSDSNIEHRSLPLKNGTIMSGAEFCEQYFDTVINTCPISYIWKREYLQNNGIPFIEKRRMEDFDWIERNVFNAKTVCYCISIIYRYLTYQNKNSTTHIWSYETFADWVHVGYRRMKFCDSITESAPSFCNKIESQSRMFINSSLSLRRTSRLSPKDLFLAFKRIGRKELMYLKHKGGWSTFASFCMTTPFIVVIVDCFTYPLASIGRDVVHMFRAVEK